MLGAALELHETVQWRLGSLESLQGFHDMDIIAVASTKAYPSIRGGIRTLAFRIRDCIEPDLKCIVVAWGGNAAALEALDIREGDTVRLKARKYRLDSDKDPVEAIVIMAPDGLVVQARAA